MLKILQARLQQYVNHELPAVKAGFRKGRGTRDQIANIRWITEKKREFQKNICYCCCLVASVVSDSVQPHRQQPTRLPCPWDSPGKNTGVGCHRLLQCMKGKSESEVVQSCPTLRPHGLQPTALLITPKPLTMWITTNCGKFLKR